MIARSVFFEVLQPRDRLFHARPVSHRHPPHHEVSLLEMLEPFRAATVKTFMNGLINEALERLDALPHRHIDGDARIGIGPRAGGIAAVVDETPDEAGRAFGQPVDQPEVIGEIGHARIVDLVADAADVQLRQMMIRRLLHDPYSAASRTAPCGSALRVYWSMRRSISGRKCRSRPCTGQAAPSPKAQMVWPSICCVTSISMPISRFCARPSAMRVKTRHIQPMPSRQGVHWPQLSCL